MDAEAIDRSKRRQRGGRLGGRSRSEKKVAAVRINLAKARRSQEPNKAAASRANGKLGGRPKNALAEARALDAIFGTHSERESTADPNT